MNNDVRELVSKLVALQETEKEIRRLSEALGRVDRLTADLDAQQESLVAEVEAAKAQIQEINKRYRALESELQANQGRIEKGHEKLRSVKTNKEYQSGLKEIEELKQMGSRVEDEMLACLDQLEQGKARSKEAQAALDSRQKQIRADKDAVLEGAEKDRSRLLKVQEECQALFGRIPADALTRYRRVVATKPDGNGIVPVEDAVCRGCNVNIPPQMYNELQRMDRLKNCPNCERIIYWQYKEDRSE
jgi:hypothetical protein